MISINEWYGRLGNNIIQLGTACHIADIYGHSEVKFPPHYLFIGSSVFVRSEENKCSKNVESVFFFDNSPFPAPSLQQIKEAVLKFVKPIMKEKIESKYIDTFDYTEAMIHLRGGDVFNFRKVHSGYVPAPYDFFLKCSKNFSRVGVVAEDHKHPAHKLLLNDRQFLDMSSGNVIQDLCTLCSARTLIVGPGTFWMLAYIFSSRVEKIYVTKVPNNAGSFDEDNNFFDGVNISFIPLPGYIRFGSWKNTFWQRRKIINYMIPDEY